jgi:hypothetical protein
VVTETDFLIGTELNADGIANFHIFE